MVSFVRHLWLLVVGHKSSKILESLNPPAHGGTEGSVRLTKNLACSFLRCRLNGSRSLGRQLGRYRAPPSLESAHWEGPDIQPFLKRWGPLSDLRRHWFAYTVTSDEQTRLGSEPRPHANGVSLRVALGLESDFGPVRHEWLYRITQRSLKRSSPITTTTWGHSQHGLLRYFSKDYQSTQKLLF